MAYLYIFAGSYSLFFVASWLYVLISRYNAAMLFREHGLTEEKIHEQLVADEWKGMRLANRSTVVNGTLFGMLLALAYTATMYIV